MSDPGNRPGSADPEPTYEAGELRRRQEEEFRRERERRAQETDEHRHVPETSWTPPPEIAARGKRSVMRVLLFLLAVAGLYLAIGFVTERLFAPELTLLHPVVPGTVTPNAPATVGLYARNVRMREGAAYALLILEDGTEIEGPVVIVPPHDSVLVPVQVILPAGDHVTSMVLYDAWRDNVEVAEVHGVLIRAGMPRVDVLEATLEPVVRPGEPIVVQLALVNRSEWDAAVVPLVVFTPESGAGVPIEVSLGRMTVPGGQTLDASRAVAPGTVPPGRYVVAVVNVTDAGDRTGEGVHGIPFALP
jgi:hypothetical protein